MLGISPLVDIARTRYSKSPPWMRRALAPVVQHLPHRYRFGRTFHHWRAQIVRGRTDADFCYEQQQTALRRILSSALEKSPYYRETIGPVLGDAIDRGDPIDDALWQRVPVIDGDVVAVHRDRMCTMPRSKLDKISTGGSSGKPLSFYTDKDRSPTEFAFINEAWRTVGRTEEGWHAIFRGFQFEGLDRQPFEVDSALEELRFSVFHMTEALMPIYLAEIKRRNIRYLKGYPSGLGILAGFMVSRGLADERVRGVLLHSEYLHEIYRSNLKRAFPNAEVRACYGLSEKCAFALECAEPAHYEFNPLYGLTELLDANNRPITRPGVRGRIVTTGLLFGGMPFIRYDTQDEAELISLPDRANGYRLRVRDILPRIESQMIVTRGGDLFEPRGLFIFGDELERISEMQFVQSEPGIVEMQCVLRAGASSDGPQAFARQVEKKLGGNIVVDLKIVDSIPRTMRGKRPMTIQKLDVSRYVR